MSRSICGRGSGIADDDRRNAMGGENVGGQGDKTFAEKARVATNDHTRTGRLERAYMAGDTNHGASNILKGELICHDGAPARGPELDLHVHKISGKQRERSGGFDYHGRSRLFAVNGLYKLNRSCSHDRQEDRTDDYRLEK